jgi:hypothetical protein
MRMLAGVLLKGEIQENPDLADDLVRPFARPLGSEP